MFTKQEPIGRMDRFLNAVAIFFGSVFGGLFTVFWAPFASIQEYMRATKTVWDYDKIRIEQERQRKLLNPDDDEPWKKEHREHYN